MHVYTVTTSPGYNNSIGHFIFTSYTCRHPTDDIVKFRAELLDIAIFAFFALTPGQKIRTLLDRDYMY